MRRTIFTLTHAALAALAYLWGEVLTRDEQAAGLPDDHDNAQALWCTVCQYVDEALLAVGLTVGEYAREHVAEHIYNAMRSDEELPFVPEGGIVLSIKWVIDLYYFKTGEGRLEQGGLRPGEFGLMAEG